MIVGTVTLPSGVQLDPQRPMLRQIDIHDIATNLAAMPVYCGPLTLEISAGQSALNAAGIYERISPKPELPIIHYLLLRNAWQYALKDVSIPAAHMLERGCLDQLRDIQEGLQNKILAKFDSPPTCPPSRDRKFALRCREPRRQALPALKSLSFWHTHPSCSLPSLCAKNTLNISRTGCPGPGACGSN